MLYISRKCTSVVGLCFISNVAKANEAEEIAWGEGY